MAHRASTPRSGSAAMIYYLLLLLSIVLTVSKSALCNAYAKHAEPTRASTFSFNAVAYGAAALISVVSLALGRGTIRSLSTLLCALIYAAVVFSLQTATIAAMRVGPMSATAICVMYGMVIPSLAGPLFWHETFGVLQALGIVAMLLSLWLLQERDPDSAKPMSKKWGTLAAIAFLLSGMAGLIEKIHQSTDGRSEKAEFVFVACLAMLLISALATLATRKERGTTNRQDGMQMLRLAAPTGIVIGIYSSVNLTLAGVLDSMIYYPLANGGAMLLTMLASCLLFRERFDRRRSIGMALGLVGVLCLSIPI